MDYTREIMNLLDRSHSPFHAVSNMKEAFLKKGYIELQENLPFDLKEGKGYFLTRNDSSIIAFSLPFGKPHGFRIASTHNDSPSFVLKPNPILNQGAVCKLNTEPYGGGLYYTWLDRPLSFAGRVYSLLGDGSQKCALVDYDKDALVIPSLAIHMNREANSGLSMNPAKTTLPLWLDHNLEGSFPAFLKKQFDLEGEVVSFDLSLYVRENAREVGGEGAFLLSPRLDDLSSAYANLLAFLDGQGASANIPLFASFDNEEVGSLTQQGANSDFLRNVIRRILSCLGLSEEEKQIIQANSVMLSVDNAHANHPNYPELSDATTKVNMNQGIVIKYNAAQHYTTNAKSGAYVKMLCKNNGLAYQEFTNRSDLRGGSTLGNLSNSEISLLCADIGIAQLAMHSSVELCGKKDIDDMVKLLKAHYKN